MTFLENVTSFLQSIGVQKLSAHDILKLHILPAISEEKMANVDKMLMIEYICYVMLHLRTTCSDCSIEREFIISELQCKPSVLTNYGFKCPSEVPIHFCREYGNPVNAKVLADVVSMRWHEVDINYLRHPINESLSFGLTNWREFFKEIGITDFVQIVQLDKNVADVSDAAFKQVMWDRALISPDSIARDWESQELLQLVSLLSKSGNKENCKCLLEVLDALWDSCYSDKTNGYFSSKSGGDGYPFKSTFICSLCDFQCVASTMDDELHYPKDLFYDCEEVRKILGASAPYAVPKVKSERLVSDIGFKTSVTLGDILDIFKVWRKSKTPFKASIAQMSKLYAFVWNEMGTSKQKIMEELLSGPFIFIPFSPVSRQEDIVCGMFLSPDEVYWHDSTGSVEQMKEIHLQSSSTEATHFPPNKSLCNIYPGLRGFFVDGCGVQKAPPLCSYIQILQQLSTVTLPSQAANRVFQVFVKWADGLKSALLSPDDIRYLNDCLSKLEFTVLPTVQDKWVSLHPSFGLVCWSDDKSLKKEFKHLDNLDFLYFGELNKDDKEILQTKISTVLKILGIPALSEVVTRKAICYGFADCSSKESLVNWILPYAQRYIHELHGERYAQLKQSGFDILSRLKVIVVEKLFYRNAINSCHSESKKRVECSCLLEENILYTTEESDYHALFMELSRLLFDGTPALHLANFLHMITTMAESGSPKEQIEIFILNSQRVPKLPDEESVWSLSPVSSSIEIDKLHASNLVPLTNEQIFPRRKTGVNSNWPPADWKTAPDFKFARANGFKTQAGHVSSFVEIKDDDTKSTITQPVCTDPNPVSADWTIKEEPTSSSMAMVLPETVNFEEQSCRDFESTTALGLDTGSMPEGLGEELDEPQLSWNAFSKRDQLQTGTPDAAQAMITGRLGERLAFKYFVGKIDKTAVKWVNEVNETGLPYDLVIGEKTNREFIEVKTTRSPRKDWFIISPREWQFAVDKGESYSIAHVALMGNNVARITLFKNPVKLCQLGELQLAVMMPRQQREFSVVSTQ
ncbi:hypothetical protein L6164_025391 [Bauhinia variegata]|uniref:Uncharacterized protein n=1 Tax=Bauhinia variegata TaxID=167791 RepID=A0ACB9M267_BAUVA|nr:hypothetical protein L6164_025391 [Bauhinia variegata]